MLYGLVDILQKNRRLIFVAAFISIDILLVTFCTHMLQAHRTSITNRIRNSESALNQPQYQDDIFSGGSMFDNVTHVAGIVEVKALRTTVAATDGIVKAEKGLQTATAATLHALHTAASATVRTIGMVCGAIVRTIGRTIIFMGRVIIFPFVAVGHGTAQAFGFVSRPINSRLASVIQPQNNAEVPVITAAQAEQVSLIQQDTLAVAPIKPTGAGGACDNGAGNGGYPMEWCDARMDTIQTVAYSSDHINRQCTSYAYWYFTAIEGHTDFHVTGNANRWARTSNYPTHTTPAVGAIAVQTGGYYGHVAIVQALPGQTHDGKVVPDGYVLVSEMNYDWLGHFRYSYSPLAKFSAYIYPN